MLMKVSPMQTVSNNLGTLAVFLYKRKPGHHRLQNQPTKRQPLAYRSLLMNWSTSRSWPGWILTSQDRNSSREASKCCKHIWRAR
jgi:hypothetical protein